MKGKKHSEWRTQRQLSKKELQLRVGSRQRAIRMVVVTEHRTAT